jgi:hypothetical protein
MYKPFTDDEACIKVPPLVILVGFTHIEILKLLAGLEVVSADIPVTRMYDIDEENWNA